jgi:hypothetical protein
MADQQIFMVNCVLGWTLLCLSVLGYVFTQRRFNERWFAWALLATGWGFFSLAQTFLVVDKALPLVVLITLWLSSYIMVISAIILLFLKLIHLKAKN